MGRADSFRAMHLFELRRDIEFTPLVRDGVELVVARDPINDNYMDLQPAQYELLTLADGKTTPEEICAALAEAGIAASAAEISTFLRTAARRGLMTLSSLPEEVTLSLVEVWKVRRRVAAFLKEIAPLGTGAPWRRAADSAVTHLRMERIVLAARALEEALDLGAPPACRRLLDQITALQFQSVG